MSKKIWMLMLALCMVLCVVAVASAETCAENEHKWVTTNIKTPGSCSKDEIVEQTCTKCGDTQYVNEGRKHDWVVTVLSAGDCTTNKIVKKTCACGVTEVENKGVQHKYAIEVEAGTCFKPTWIGYKCTECGIKQPDRDPLYVGPFADHIWVKSTNPKEYKNATCTAAGWAKMTCAKCGATKQVTYPATGHNFMTTTEIVKATCGQNGGYLVKCTRCSATKIDVIKENGKAVYPMPADEHTFSVDKNEWTYVPATCLKAEYYLKTCETCGKVVPEGTGNTAKGAHNKVLKSTVKAATCTEDGLGSYACSVCGASMGYDLIPSTTAHELTVTRTEAATCAAPGKQYLACANCDYVTEKTLPQLSHEIVTKTFHGECGVEQMYTAKACVNCDYVNEATKNFLGVYADHEYVLNTKDPDYVYAAPCSEKKGLDTFKCKYCAATYTIETFGDHTWEVTDEVVKATCGQDGGLKQVCTACGKVGVYVVTDKNGQPVYPSKNHTVDGVNCLAFVENVPSTCHEYGYAVLQCTNCGEKKIDYNDYLDPDNHVYEVVEVLTAANCKLQVNGVVREKCKYHNTAVQVVTLDWNDAHNWVTEEVKAATCVAGYKKVTCSICKETTTEPLPAVNAHKFVKMTSTATCTVPAFYGEFCEVCETPKNESSYNWAVDNNKSSTYYMIVEGSKKDHTETKVEVVKEATCEENGSYKYYCPDCKTTYTKTIPNKGGHNYIKGAYVPATCEKGAGYKYTCSKCQDTKTVYIEGSPNLGGHLASDETLEKKSTCSTLGYKYNPCKRCGYEMNKDTTGFTINSAAHTWDKTQEKIVTAATCTTNGLKIQVCKDCGIKQHVIIKADHAWDKGIVIDAGSCEKGATVEYKCTVCGEKKTVTEAVAHAWVEDLVNADGTVVYKECSVCGKRVITQDFRPAGSDKNDCNTFGHKEVATAGKAPTCTEKGLTSGTKCSVCGTVLVAQKEIDKLPHNFQGANCADCGASNPNYVEHEHKCTKSYSFNADFTKRVVTYTCECGYTYSEEEDF